MSINYQTFARFVEIDELDLEYQRITSNIYDVVDVDAALETIFQLGRSSVWE
jgi:hypothetical protein